MVALMVMLSVRALPEAVREIGSPADSSIGASTVMGLRATMKMPPPADVSPVRPPVTAPMTRPPVLVTKIPPVPVLAASTSPSPIVVMEVPEEPMPVAAFKLTEAAVMSPPVLVIFPADDSRTTPVVPAVMPAMKISPADVVTVTLPGDVKAGSVRAPAEFSTTLPPALAVIVV